MTMRIARAGAALLVLATGCTVMEEEGNGSDDTSDALGLVAGDYHFDARTLDENFMVDGAILELRLVTDGGCKYQAVQVAGDCKGDKDDCSDQAIYQDPSRQKRIAGECALSDAELVLHIDGEDDLVFQVSPRFAAHHHGFVLKTDREMTVAGDELFIFKTSMKNEEILGRVAFDFNETLSKEIDPADPKLSPAVRKGLAKLMADLEEPPFEDISRSVDFVSAVFATPFDSEPKMFAVEASHSGDHCGGFEVFAVSALGNRLKASFSDGDCGL